MFNHGFRKRWISIQLRKQRSFVIQPLLHSPFFQRCFFFNKETCVHKHNLRGLSTNTVLVILLNCTTWSISQNESQTRAKWVWHEQHEGDASNANAARVRYKRRRCDTSATWTTRVRHEWKTLVLIRARVKTYFQTPALAIWQMKDYTERNNFILRTTFSKCLVPMPKCVWKVYDKNWSL